MRVLVINDKLSLKCLQKVNISKLEDEKAFCQFISTKITYNNTDSIKALEIFTELDLNVLDKLNL